MATAKKETKAKLCPYSGPAECWSDFLGNFLERDIDEDDQSDRPYSITVKICVVLYAVPELRGYVLLMVFRLSSPFC